MIYCFVPKRLNFGVNVKKINWQGEKDTRKVTKHEAVKETLSPIFKDLSDLELIEKILHR